MLKQCKGGSSGERRKPDRALQREGKRKARGKEEGRMMDAERSRMVEKDSTVVIL